MRVKLAYGKSGLEVDVPDSNLVKVLSMKKQQAIEDSRIAIIKSLLSPINSYSLFDIAKNKKSACILISDITRPVPNKLVLPPILKTLHAAGLEPKDILILIATGMHRPNLGDELIELVGQEIASKYKIENHYYRNSDQHTYLGETSRGTPVWIDSRYLEAELKIATGFIEPHLMAGFSGGRKLIVPGIASIETMKYMHGPALLDHPNSREGVIDGNPFHQEALEIARMAGADFILNVSLDEDKNITGIFAGELEKAHEKGVEFVRASVSDFVTEPVDIVITTSAGYPLDKTWYQAIKGLTAAMPIVKEGGTIIIAAECSERLGSKEFTELVLKYSNMKTFMEDIYKDDFFVIDQWQLQEYAKVSFKANIALVSQGLSTEIKNAMHINWFETVEEALQDALSKYGQHATVAVIPKGPYVLAELKSRS